MRVSMVKPHAGRRRRIVLDSDSDGDEGVGRPDRRGCRPTQTEGYGGGEGVDHGRGREELRVSEIFQYPASWER